MVDGCGIDISKLAPNGARINNAAKETSGSVSFMNLYSMVTQIIGQNGRRGALMISMDCSHPDIEQFIDIKKDLNKVTKANISVKITDKFMTAVKNKEKWKLLFTREETNEVIEKEIDADYLFTKLCKNNWEMAEPGVLFWDKINNYNLLSEDDNFEYSGVNPCFTGDMRLLTENNFKTFKELEGKTINLINANGDKAEGKVWCSGEKDIIELALSNGKKIKCTPDHIFLTNRR